MIVFKRKYVVIYYRRRKMRRKKICTIQICNYT